MIYPYTVNEFLEFDYPISTNLHRLQFPDFQTRVIMVKRIRDLVTHPLTPEEFIRRPLIQRGRYLLGGVDLSTGMFKQFYEASFRQHLRIVPLRVAVFCEYGERPQYIYYRTFTTPRERMLLARALGRGIFTPPPGMKIGIYADDLKLVGIKQ